MSIIDDEGNLFGRINVIDALAVVLLLAVVIAGVAVVGVLSSDGEPETRYATVELGTQPAYVVDNIEEGDNLAAEDASGNLTVTDIYVTAAAEGAVVTVRTEVEGRSIVDDGDDRFTFDGSPLRAGNELHLETADLTATGQVTKVDQSGTELPTETESVLLETTVSPSTADQITEGDTIEIGAQTIATVTNVQSYPIDSSTQERVHVGIELEGIRDGGSLTYATRPLRLGTELAFRSDTYEIHGKLIRRGTDEVQSETASRYVTLDLGAQPSYIVERVTAGDTMVISDEELTVTDVYAAPAGGEKAHLSVRASVDGKLVESFERETPVYQFAGDRLRVGDTLEIDVADYITSGQVTSVETTGDTLEHETTPVLLESTVSATTAAEIRIGDTFDVGPHTVATVTNVQSYPIGNEERRVHVGIELETLTRGTTPTFAGERVTVETQLSLASSAYELTGDVIRRGATEPVGEQREATAEVKLENVDPDVADSLQEGMTETNRGEIDATIETIETQPAEVVLESDDGNIYLREHPKNKDVRLTVTLRTVTTDSGVRFHGESLRENDTIVLDFDTVFVGGTVTNLELED